MNIPKDHVTCFCEMCKSVPDLLDAAADEIEKYEMRIKVISEVLDETAAVKDHHYEVYDLIEKIRAAINFEE